MPPKLVSLHQLWGLSRLSTAPHNICPDEKGAHNTYDESDERSPATMQNWEGV
jgi:hypothetical protein